LLEQGASINFQFNSIQPLALALYHFGKPQDHDRRSSSSAGNSRLVSRRRLVERLIKAGAYVNRASFIDNAWITPLKQAKTEELKDVEKLLLNAGAKKLDFLDELEAKRYPGMQALGYRPQLLPPPPPPPVFSLPHFNR
jgi:hypothetical protein